MVVELFLRSIFNIDTFHRFSYFLGTNSGELLKRSVEGIFYFIILYMLVSEFSRSGKRDYKYLIIGFFSLFLRQVFMSIILFSRVFAVDKFMRFEYFISSIDGYLEMVALLLLVSAFLFPCFKDKTFIFQKRIILCFYAITVIAFLNYISFRFMISGQGLLFSIMNLLKMIILLVPLYLLTRDKYKIKHLKSIWLAFFIYFLMPFTSFISILAFGNIDPRLAVMQHPLPFLSILLLMRTVYLTLVDKAFLNMKLIRSEKNLKHEKELSELKDHFISVVSHELRTPITSMKLYMSLFTKGRFGKVSKKQKEALGVLLDENNRLSDLIANLLTINKIEAKKLAPNKVRFNLKDIIDKMYINFARKKGISTISHIRKGFYVNGDKKMIKQIYINLMNNAIKFSEKGGKIEISAGRKNKGWFFSVKDYGMGIPKEEIPKLFNKFYQVDNQLKNNPGIGLGLAIVKNIVELHNGRVELKSKLGNWTEFKVWIPD